MQCVESQRSSHHIAMRQMQNSKVRHYGGRKNIFHSQTNIATVNAQIKQTYIYFKSFNYIPLLSILCVPDEDYCRNAWCGLTLISTFVYLVTFSFIDLMVQICLCCNLLYYALLLYFISLYSLYRRYQSVVFTILYIPQFGINHDFPLQSSLTHIYRYNMTCLLVVDTYDDINVPIDLQSQRQKRVKQRSLYKYSTFNRFNSFKPF